VMPFHFLFHIIPFNSIFSLIYLTYLMMVMLDWFNLGLASLLSAWAFWLGNAFALLVVWGFIAYITRFQIEPEERILEQKFGESYRQYKQNVARWL
ncbi:methyltransferase family protein, partial [Glaesserella parasuis]